jgi:hypothetical protein
MQVPPEMNRGAGKGSPNSIANLQPNKTTPAEQISQPETAVVGENPTSVVLYLQRRFGLSLAVAIVVSELALFAKCSR